MIAFQPRLKVHVAASGRRLPDSRVFDAEKVGETLMDITPGLPGTDNFQHSPPWRQLVVETARGVLDYTGGTLVMPMTDPGRAVLARDRHRSRPTPHPGTALRPPPTKKPSEGASRGNTAIPCPLRLQYLEPSAEAARTCELGAKA
jgi:hypothetical protein